MPFLNAAANAIASDIQGARTLVRARREVTRARALRHVTQELTGQLDLTAVLDDIADRTRSLFDADKVGSHVVLRHWQPGDRFQPIGMSKPVKLQDLFTNAKVPRERRHALTLAAADPRKWSLAFPSWLFSSHLS